MRKLTEEIYEYMTTKANNEGKRTLCYFHSEPIGIIDSLVEVGGIYQLSPSLGALICASIQDYSRDFVDPENDLFYKNGCEKIAIFHHDGAVAKRYRKAASVKQEKTLAKKMGGRIQPGSGALASFKGDVVTSEFLIEAKFTDKTSYRLQLGIWNKIKNEANVKDKVPMMEICLEQNTIPVKILIIDPFDMYDVLGIDKDNFTELFSSVPLTGNKNSVMLHSSFIKNHIEDVTYNVQSKMPAFLIQIANTILIGMEVDSFLKIKND